MTKTCRDCQTEKPVSEFNRRRDAYQTYCRPCHGKRVKRRDERMRKRLPSGEKMVCGTCKQEKARALSGRNFCGDCIRAYQQRPEVKARVKMNRQRRRAEVRSARSNT